MSDCGNVQKVFVPLKEDDKDKIIEKPITGVGITDLAAEKIIRFLETDKKNATEYGLKVEVVKDGCSGKSYKMDLALIADSKANNDKIFTHNGATMMIEKLSYMFVIGSTLDYTETLLMSGFQLVNPNIKKSCSCGSSFAV